MKRGPEPVKGFDMAIPVALGRGQVMRFRSSPAYVSNFMAYGNGLVLLVCLRLAQRLSRATLAEISAGYADAIAGLCTVPCGGPVSRELWLYSRYGALRFFRVSDNGSLEEIDRDGVPFVNGKPAGTIRPASGHAGSAAPAPAANVPAGTGSADPRSPIIRWLKKKNAMKNSGVVGINATGPVTPGKIPDSGNRGPDADRRILTDAPVTSSDNTPITGSPVEAPVGDSPAGEPASSHTPAEVGGGSGG